MSSINFYLDKPDRKGDCPVQLTYVAKGKRFRFYTKQKVLHSHWDAKRQRVAKSYEGFEQINSLLDSYTEIIKQIEREALFQKRSLDGIQVKEQFERAIGMVKPVDDFHSAYLKYLDRCKSTKTEGTVKAFTSAYNKLKSFELRSGYVLTFERMNKQFYDHYVHYLVHECGHLNNTVGRFIKSLKFFLNYTLEIGVNRYNEFKKFKVLDEEVDLIYLTDTELMRLYVLEIENSTLHNVRENFCFECFTGLRFSDVSKLENVHLDGNMLKVKTQKTKTALSIPLNNYALGIIQRNSGKFDGRFLPPCLSLQKTNDSLKKLGELAEFDDLVHLVKFSGARRIESNRRKHELLTTHAARRTFITLSLEKGMRPEIVMLIVGIKKWETFKRYIKINDAAKIIEMNTAWNNSQLKAI